MGSDGTEHVRRRVRGTWALMALFVLCWLYAPANPVWSLLLANFAYLAYLIHTSDLLPERVASHFDFQLRADKYMRRRTLLVVFGALGLLGLSGTITIFYFVLRGGRADFMARHLLWLGCLMLGFLAGIHALVVAANRRDPPSLPKTFWALLGLFEVAILAWAATIMTHEKWGWPP